MADNMKYWDALRTPPKDALKKITGGRLSGMTDISPQWRYKAMTELFGPCGIGWKYEIANTWTQVGSNDQLMVFASVAVYIKHEGEWSDPVHGIGGSMLITQESKGLHTSDEGYKMAVTDALSVALKMLGVGADIYMGVQDGKYGKPVTDAPKTGTIGKVEAGPDKEKEELIAKIGKICIQIADGDKSQAGGVLHDLTHWEDNGEVKREGVRSARDLKAPKFTIAALRTIYGKAKKALETWESAHGPVESADGDGSTYDPETGEYTF